MGDEMETDSTGKNGEKQGNWGELVSPCQS